jgi:serine/threonine protein kinase
MLLNFKYPWKLGTPLDKGGFGRIFEAGCDVVPNAVAKLVPKAPGAKREFLFVNFEGVRNVVPILDQGEIDDCWVLIMPKAAESLRKKLTRSGGKVPSVDAIAILNDVATALVDLEKKAVHRDLKPENILHLDGKWCLADFGISRYAEASTATDTHKFSMTPPYAAPEQWRAEHATSATDIYAFGCIACEILSGSVPFSGSHPA